LALLDESVRNAIYCHIERSCGIGRQEIPERLDAFHHALKGLLGEVGKIVETVIAKSLYGKLGLAFRGHVKRTAVERINHAKKVSGES